MSAAEKIILVTGSSGFVGRRLVGRLAERAQVIGLDIQEPADPSGLAAFVPIDLTDDASVDEATRRIAGEHGARIASVVHLAAYFDLSGEPDPKYQAVTVEGTRRLLRALRDLEVEQFVFSSTMLVHAAVEPGNRVDEDRPIEPKLPYRASKVETEALIRAERDAIPVVLLRAAGIYDDWCRSQFIANQIARIFEESPKSRVYPGDTTTAQAWLHVDDLADAVVRLVERRRNLPEELELLIGEPDAMPYEAIQNRIGRLLHGRDWSTWQVPKPLAKAGAWVEDKVMGEDPFVQPWMIDVADDDYTLDISRARELLDWQPRHKLYDSLARMIATLKDDPTAWYEENGLDPQRLATVPQAQPAATRR
jgi:nucleoside-diphosphate-sugar epimerase